MLQNALLVVLCQEQISEKPRTKLLGLPLENSVVIAMFKANRNGKDTKYTITIILTNIITIIFIQLFVFLLLLLLLIFWVIFGKQCTWQVERPSWAWHGRRLHTAEAFQATEQKVQ